MSSSYFNAFPAKEADSKLQTDIGPSSLIELPETNCDSKDTDAVSVEQPESQNNHKQSMPSLGSLSLIPTNPVKQATSSSLNLNSYGLSGLNSFGLKNSVIGLTGSIVGSSYIPPSGDPGALPLSNSNATNPTCIEGGVSIPLNQQQQQQKNGRHTHNQSNQNQFVQAITGSSIDSSPSMSSGSSSHFTHEIPSPSSSTSSLVSAPVAYSSTSTYPNVGNSGNNSALSSSITQQTTATLTASPGRHSAPFRNTSSSAVEVEPEGPELSVSGPFGSSNTRMSGASRRNSVFFPDSRGSLSNISNTTTTNPNMSNNNTFVISNNNNNNSNNSTAPSSTPSSGLNSPALPIPSLTSPRPSMSVASSSTVVPPVYHQRASKPSNNLVSLLDRFSSIGDITRSAEYAANDIPSPYSFSLRSSRHNSFTSNGSASAPAPDIYGLTSSGTSFPSPFASPGPSMSRMAPLPPTSSPWQQTTVSLSSGSSTSTVVSPALSSSVTPQQQIQSAFVSSRRSSFEDAFGPPPSNPNGGLLPQISEATNLSSARSPIFQSTYSSVFSSPVSTSSSVVNDGWQSPQHGHQQHHISSADSEFGYKSPVFNSAPGLDNHQRSPYMRSSPAGSRFSPQSASVTPAEKTLRQQLAYQQQQFQQDQFLQQSTSTASSRPPSSPFKFNPHASFMSNAYDQSYDHSLYDSPSAGPSASASITSSPADFVIPPFVPRSTTNPNNAHTTNTAPVSGKSANRFKPAANSVSDTRSPSSNSSSLHGNHGRGRKSHDTSVSSLRSPLLEEFRTSKTNRYELKDIYGHIVEFSGDQYGSRFIQSKLESASSEEKQIIFNELRSDSLQLMTDVFGNYVIQKFFELGNQMQKTLLAQQMEGRVLSLSLQMYGCRVVQKAIEHILTDQQARLIRELDGHVLQCIKDQNGNHVIQKAIERIPPQHIQFILKSFDNQVLDLATHAYGCRVIQRMLEYCDKPAQTELLKEIHRYAYHLIDDQYGNYVIQHVIERGNPEDRDRVIDIVCSSLVVFSRHKFASNVVEKCIIFGSPNQRRQFVDKILETSGGDAVSKMSTSEASASSLCLMMKDQYANYVIQKLLEKVEKDQRERLIESIKAHLQIVKKITVSKHVASIERILELDAVTNGSGKEDSIQNYIENGASKPAVKPAVGSDPASVKSPMLSRPSGIKSAVPPSRPAGLPSGPAASSSKTK